MHVEVKHTASVDLVTKVVVLGFDVVGVEVVFVTGVVHLTSGWDTACWAWSYIVYAPNVTEIRMKKNATYFQLEPLVFISTFLLKITFKY